MILWLFTWWSQFSVVEYPPDHPDLHPVIGRVELLGGGGSSGGGGGGGGAVYILLWLLDAADRKSETKTKLSNCLMNNLSTCKKVSWSFSMSFS